MKRILFTSIILCVTMLQAYAQTPGYLGNKMTLTLDLDWAPDIIALSEDPFQDANRSYMHIRPGLGISYAVSRKTALGLYFGYSESINTGQQLGSEDFDDSSIPLGYSLAEFSDYLRPLSRYQKTRIMDFGLSYQKFVKSYIAPAGSFFEVKAVLVTSKTEFYDSLQKALLVRPIPTSKTGYSFKATIGYVHNHIFMDRILIRYGYEIGWDFGGAAALAGLNSSNFNSYLNDTYLTNQSKVNSFYSSLLTLKMGIGFIPPISN